MYNLTVDTAHTFFVGEGQWLVHNACPKPVKPYEVGTYNDLLKKSPNDDGLQIHHAPQGHPAGQIINNYDYANAPAIALPNPEHIAVNRANLRGPYGGTPRDLLAKTIRDLRNYTNAPNSALQKLVRLNKNRYPGVYAK